MRASHALALLLLLAGPAAAQTAPGAPDPGAPEVQAPVPGLPGLPRPVLVVQMMELPAVWPVLPTPQEMLEVSTSWLLAP